MVHPLVEYFRCPPSYALTSAAPDLPAQSGYFRVGAGTAYGRQSAVPVHSRADGDLQDVLPDASRVAAHLQLPFDLAEVLDNLRRERYPEAQKAIEHVSTPTMTRGLYYLVRPLLPVQVRKHLQRLHWQGWRDIAFPRWPVDTSVQQVMRSVVGRALSSGAVQEFPFVWFWPEGAQGCAMMTHDVEGTRGAAFCDRLMDTDDRFAIPSSFQVVPDPPPARGSRSGTRQLVDRLKRRGFEVNVHDLTHDGYLFQDRERFLKHASIINARGREFGSRGFRSGAMYRRQDWLAALDVAYDMSVPNVAHLEPQQGGCCTVMPYFNGHVLELPLTVAQDYTVFHVLGEYSTQLWRQQMDAILAEHGVASFIAHPDYLAEPRALAVYEALLAILDERRRDGTIWLAAPAAIDRWWRQRGEMSLVREGGRWRIKGEGSERARLAWVRIESSRVVYDIDASRHAA